MTVFLNGGSLEDFSFSIEYYIALCIYGCILVKLLDFSLAVIYKKESPNYKKRNFMEVSKVF